MTAWIYFFTGNLINSYFNYAFTLYCICGLVLIITIFYKNFNFDNLVLCNSLLIIQQFCHINVTVFTPCLLLRSFHKKIFFLNRDFLDSPKYKTIFYVCFLRDDYYYQCPLNACACWIVFFRLSQLFEQRYVYNARRK